MTFNCLTLFPEQFSGFMQTGLAARAVQAGLVRVELINFREHTTDRHRRVDDYPFSGGPGMLLMPQPLFDCFADLESRETGRVRRIYMSPAGKPFSQADARRLAAEYDTIDILCGRYEGVDQRVIDTFIDEEISIGDYVLTGGELPAMVLMDACMRLLPGFVGNDDSLRAESMSDGLLEYPQYTRPSNFRGQPVPEVLLSGDHARIEKWKHQQALLRTLERRPDLLAGRHLSREDQELIEKIKEAGT
ncbi:MAG: tRNA (guanosine(37)-N1)-methyltransferase TrmD [Clostridia bacterium]|nr:tRNA (guanosine(37)-N1)-methyltransferase TrmD [Clostridia bacterium]